MKKAIKAAIFGLGLALAIPTVSHLVKWGNAKSLVGKVESKYSELQNTLSSAESSFDSAKNLMPEKDLVQKYQDSISKAKDVAFSVKNSVEGNERLFSMGQYNIVRSNLSSTFGIGNGVTRKTSINDAQEQIEVLNGVVRYCRNVNDLRNKVTENVAILKAYLSAPQDPNVAEVPKELENVPIEILRSVVPSKDSHLEAKLEGLGIPQLRNGLGALLLSHEPLLSHILEYGKTDSAKSTANIRFNSAKDYFSKVDSLSKQIPVVYSPTQHDGKFTVRDYENLLSEQNKAVSQIDSGKRELQELRNFFQLFEDSHYTIVTGHDKRRGILSDSDDPHKFYYTEDTISPNGTTSEELYSGKGTVIFFEFYTYPTEQEIGWVRNYKPKHSDQVFDGRVERLNPNVTKPCKL